MVNVKIKLEDYLKIRDGKEKTLIYYKTFLELISDIEKVSDAEIKSNLLKLIGIIMQRPSSVSAIKIDGKRAYDRVREGEVVELPAREVTIYSLEILEISRAEGAIAIKIDVSSTP